MKLKDKLINIIYKKNIQTYTPNHIVLPKTLLEVDSAWKGLESIIEDILNRFDIERNKCIEFGVEFGYSTVALSNYFNSVTGIDIFTGDRHTVNKEYHYEQTKERLSVYPNIQLIKSDYKDWILKDDQHYNFAHVDIVHTYEDTFKCGLWAAQHSDCTVFHDTESFRDVRNAVIDIAKATGQELYNYPKHFGLGILVNRPQ